MNPRAAGPLTDKDYERINRTLADLEVAHAEVQRAKNAGFECADEDAQCQALRDSLMRIKRVYFPERP